jgi:hypothetical protein
MGKFKDFISKTSGKVFDYKNKYDANRPIREAARIKRLEVKRQNIIRKTKYLQAKNSYARARSERNARGLKIVRKGVGFVRNLGSVPRTPTVRQPVTRYVEVRTPQMPVKRSGSVYDMIYGGEKQ